jgi:drug/metabolite transporter (DMT)-like permease
MEAGMAGWTGPILVLTFALSQAFRDVYFGAVFQRLDFFSVIVLTFSLSTAIFLAVVLLRAPADLLRLRGHSGAVVGANLTTAAAWSCFFFALTSLDPAIVNTIHSAMGPLTVAGLGVMNFGLARPKPIGRIETVAYGGIALSVIGLCLVVIGGYSGLAASDFAASAAGLAALAVSGVSITVSLLYCKRLQDCGIGADAVTVVRYVVLIVLAAAVLSLRGSNVQFVPAELAALAAAAVILIVLPLYLFQLGIGRTAPLTAQIIRALGPAFVFALEQFDGRLRYSWPTLICILLYSASVVVGNIAHGWVERSGGGEAAVRRRRISSA